MSKHAYISANTVESLSHAHHAVTVALDNLSQYYSTEKVLQQLLPLPNLISDISSPSSLQYLDPFLCFSLTSPGPRIHSILPPRLSLLAQTAAHEIELHSNLLPNVLPHTSSHQLLLTLSANLHTRGISSVLLIHQKDTFPSLPTLPFQVISCTPSDLVLINDIPHYQVDPGVIIPIQCACVELTREDLVSLPLHHLETILKLARHGKLLQNLLVSFLVEDANLLHILCARPELLKLEKKTAETIFRFITPTLPAREFSLPAAVIGSDSYLVRHRFLQKQSVILDKFAAVDHVAKLSDTNWMVQPCPQNSVEQQFDCSSFVAGLGGSFFGVSTLTAPNKFLLPSIKNNSTVYFSSKVSEKVPLCHVYYKSLSDAQGLELIRKVSRHGIVLIAVSSTPEEKILLKYVRDDLHGKNVRVFSDVMQVGSFGEKGRQNVEELCTSLAEEMEPPRMIVVSGATHRQSSPILKLRIGKVADCIDRLDRKTVHILRTTAVKWFSPNSGLRNDENDILAPVLMSSTRVRMNRACMSTSHLSRDQQRIFAGAYNALCETMTSLSEEIIISAPFVFMIDNHSYAHSIVGFPYGNALAQKISFDLEQHPALYRVLESAYHHPLYKSILNGFNSSLLREDHRPDKFLQLSKWPISNKNEYLSGVNKVFTRMFFSNPEMYWSASSGTTGSSGFSRMDSVFPTAVNEMHLMRDRLREKYVEKGLITSTNVVANLLNWGNMATSLEVQCEIFQGSNITHLPMGGKISIEQTCAYIEKYGATTVIALGTRILQIAIHCQRTGRKLNTINRLLHGGENFSDRALKSFANIWHEHVKCFAIYGSSEAGIFSLKSPGEECYEIIDDSILLEIVDERSQPTKGDAVGTLVVTNLLREIHPMVRYNTGDLGHFPNSDHTKFQLKGRNPNSIKRQFGSKTVTWKDIEEAVGELIEDVFEGLCIYQIWVGSKSKGTVQLAIYGRVLTEEEEGRLRKEAVDKLDEVFTDETNVSQVLVELIQDAEDVVRKTLTTKLEFFADVDR